MRIAYISYEYPPDSSYGGIATYVAQAARMMHKRGHDVEVFASSPRRFGSIKSDGYVVHWIQETDRREFGVVAGHIFAACHRSHPFDVVEGPEYNADARKAIELVPNVPLVVKMHTPSLLAQSLNSSPALPEYLRNIRANLRAMAAAFLKDRPLEPFYFMPAHLYHAKKWDRIEAAHASQAEIVAPPCEALCEFAVTSWKISPDVVKLSPHPFSPSNEFLNLVPREKGFTLGYVGRLERRKGIEILTAALPAILNAVPEARMKFIGKALIHPESGVEYDKWIMRLLSKYADRIDFVGSIPSEEMVRAYEMVDICIFPSIWENFPNVCLESMSAGKAIVASSAGGMREMLDHGRAGRLVPSGDAAALSAATISLLRSPSERIRLGEAGRSRVLQNYNQDVIGELMEGIFSQAILRKQAKIMEHGQASRSCLH